MVHDATPASRPADSLALDVVRASHAPQLLLDGSMRILSASKSFLARFRFEPGETEGRLLRELGTGEWATPQLASLLTATLSGFADVVDYQMELRFRDSPSRQLVLNAAPLPADNPLDARLLLTIVDVTEARLADRQRDDLIREKDVLLQEVQHRVANSLQIIASVLMQSARKVQSDETRAELTNAHGRVMSIAAVQRQLSASRLGEVKIRPYLTQLCTSLGASMIADSDEIVLDVSAMDAMVSADDSIRMGLIVTELVINALKHAFPNNRRGAIFVTYSAQGSEWTLSVADDGVGMPRGDTVATPGLGTSIVEALARQLQAHVRVTDVAPGTSVEISHRDVGETTPEGAWLV
jgi:two-component system, sensor histidine kinase PdtaS